MNTSEVTSASNVFQILQDLQLKQYQDQCHSNTMHSDSKTFHTVQNMAQPVASFRTTAATGKQVNPVHVRPDTSCKAPLGHCAHDHKLTVQVCKPGE